METSYTMADDVMRLKLAITAVLACATAASAAGSAWPICASAKRVTCVVDGDTFWLNGVKYRIRGIDAPEAKDGAHCPTEASKAEAATLRLQALLKAGPVGLQQHGYDKYGRALVDVDVAGDDVGARLVDEGYARTFRPGLKRDGSAWCAL